MNSTESFLKYEKYAEIVAEFGFFTTSFFCSTLIFLTVFGVKRSFGSYTNLLILFPSVGIFFATIEIMLYPNIFSHNAGYVFFSTGRPFNVSKDAITGFMAFYTGVHATTIAMLSVQFIYRYLAIFDKNKLFYFKSWRFLYCVAYSVTFGLQWGLGLHYFGEIDDYSQNYMKLVQNSSLEVPRFSFRNEMMERYSIEISEMPGMILVDYDAAGNIRWRNLGCTINMTYVMIVQYVIMFYCAYFMYRYMEEKLELMSDSLRNLHKQFFKTLLLQIATPTIFLFAPVFLIIYLPLLDLKVDLPTGIFLCAFTIYPAADAIIAMYVVKDYRKAAKSEHFNQMENR